MLSRSLLRVARQVAAPRARTALRGPPMVFFSTQDWVLGKGMAKTSTGLTGLAVDYEAVPKMEQLRAINRQLLEEIVQFAPNDPYRINLTITARYYLQTMETCSSELQFLRILFPRSKETKSVHDLLLMGHAELQALRERLAATTLPSK